MNNLPITHNPQKFRNDNDRIKKLDTPEPWELFGVSKEGASLLKRGKVIKVSSYSPPTQADKQIESKNAKQIS